MNDYSVTVYCLVYNHEPYIEDALKGFVRQKTNFKFQVIVHDDASTDKSASIIRKYEKEYPDIIKGIYQSENQYKKNTILPNYVLPNLLGKYVAICEGDDYWIDDYKLQKQYDYMENHPKCTFCFTNAIIENQVDGSKRAFIPYSANDRAYELQDNYDLHDFYKLSFIPTASYFMNRKLYEESFFFDHGLCPAGDLKYRLYITAFGYAHFLHDVTSVYRENVANSAMSSWRKSNKWDTVCREKKIIDMILSLDEFTQHEFHLGLFEFLKMHSGYLFINSSLKSLFKKNNVINEMLASLPNREKVKSIVKLLIPRTSWKYL